MRHEETTDGLRALVGSVVGICALTAVMAVLAACETQDPLAPEGSTIKVSANPQTVVTQQGNAGCTTITATLRSKSGVRLPDQEITFSTSAGSLCFTCPPQSAQDCPPPETGLLTDDEGQASMKLSTNQTATITAQSGSVSNTTTVNVIGGNLSSITLDALPQTLSDCTEQVDLEVFAEDPNGGGIGGITITFSQGPIAGTTQMQGTITPAQPRTDGTGLATATFIINENFCNSKCSLTIDPNAPNGGACGLSLTAKDVSGAVTSPVVQINEAIP